jgi:hypothetical protein
LVFFESYLDESPKPGDGFYHFSWQFFELLNAREALFVSIDDGYCRRWILVPGKRVELKDTLFGFSGISELSNMLARRDWKFSDRVVSSPRSERDAGQTETPGMAQGTDGAEDSC